MAAGSGAPNLSVFQLEVARLFSRFLYVESCGQCLACKEGARHVTALLEQSFSILAEGFQEF